MQNEEIFDELQIIIKGIKTKKDLLDALKIKIKEADFTTYLNLYAFPN